MSFSGLPHDVHHLLAELLAASDFEGVRAVSLLTRSIQAIYRPVLLRAYTWRVDDDACKLPAGLVPANVRAHIRSLSIRFTADAPPDGRACAKLAGALGVLLIHLPSLHCLVLEQAPSLLWELIGPALEMLPQIKEFHLVDSPWLMGEQSMARTFPSPRARLVFGSRGYRPPETLGNVEDYSTMVRALTVYFVMKSAYIVYLDMPGFMVMGHMMALLEWRSLRELRLHGYPPVVADYTSLDLSGWLSALPNLEALWVEFMHSITVPQYQFCIIPPVVRRREPHPPSFLANLQTLVLHRPSADDRFFAHLPPSLRTLSLLTYPLLDRWQCTEDVPSAAPTSADMTKILSRSDVPCLHTLRISVSGRLNNLGARGSDLLETVAARFPLLEVLELHRCFMIPGDEFGSEPETLFSPLRQCGRLRDVYLEITDTLDAVEVLDERVRAHAVDGPVFGRMSVHSRMKMLKYASDLARCAPSVRTVTFLSGPQRKELLRAHFWKGAEDGIWEL